MKPHNEVFLKISCGCGLCRGVENFNFFRLGILEKEKGLLILKKKFFGFETKKSPPRAQLKLSFWLN